MSNFYKATSAKKAEDTQGVILARDEKSGEVTKEVLVDGPPVELDEAQHETAKRYLNLRKVEDVEAEMEKFQKTQPLQQPGEDVVGTGPVFSQPTVADGDVDVDQSPVQEVKNSEQVDKNKATPVVQENKGR